MYFQNKVAIVTGAARGIGKAVALKLAERGASIAACDINFEKAEELAFLIKKNGINACAIEVDISNFKQAEAMANKVKEYFKKVDILINNAAWDDSQFFMESDTKNWDRIIDINLKGTINCTRSILKYMIEQGNGGRIVNVASDAGRVGASGQAVYSASKGGVIAFTKAIAREVARYNILVNCTCPGPTDTAFLDNFEKSMPKIIEATKKYIPLKRLAKAEEQADAIIWLSSDKASYITGQTISVNGGLNMV